MKTIQSKLGPIDTGKAFVEANDDDGLLVLLPDGEIKHAIDAAQAQKHIFGWANRRTKRTGNTQIITTEWRDGIVPPAGDRET